MLKYLVAFLAVGAVTVNAQGGPLPYQAVLDPDFIVSWGLNASTEVMTVELYADTIGWAMLRVLSPAGTFLDVWWGGFDEDYNVNYGQVPISFEYSFIQCHLIESKFRTATRLSRT